MPHSTASPLRLAVLISGGGTTLLNLQEKIEAGELAAEVCLVVANRPCRGAERAAERGLPVQVVRQGEFSGSKEFSRFVFDLCRQAQVDLVVLGGFLSRIVIPEDFHNRVMNIHPALIPAFCGQGMYGQHVHRAVIERGCKVSGCTVHFCDNQYDQGPIILQRTVPVLEEDDTDRLAARVFEEECAAYPEAIRLFAEGRLHIEGGRVRIRE